MTHERPAKVTFSTVVLWMVSGICVSIGTHVVDVMEVRDKVEQLRVDQVITSQWRIESEIRIRRMETIDFPAVMEGQRKLNQRLCKFLIDRGDGDDGCLAETYESRSKKK